MEKIQCYFDGHPCTFSELEALLKFHYLPDCVFESSEERLEIRERGLELLKKGGVSEEAERLGEQYISHIQAASQPLVSVRYCNQAVGYGLFAEEDLEEGGYAGKYTGVIRKNDRRYFEPLNNYCYEYPVPDEIGRSYVIDGTSGNLMRFVNHSDRPNLKPVRVFYDGFYHLIFLAIRPIEKGTQLTFDYGKNYWYLRGRPLEL